MQCTFRNLLRTQHRHSVLLNLEPAFASAAGSARLDACAHGDAGSPCGSQGRHWASSGSGARGDAFHRRL